MGPSAITDSKMQLLQSISPATMSCSETTVFTRIASPLTVSNPNCALCAVRSPVRFWGPLSVQPEKFMFLASRLSPAWLLVVAVKQMMMRSFFIEVYSASIMFVVPRISSARLVPGPYIIFVLGFSHTICAMYISRAASAFALI